MIAVVLYILIEMTMVWLIYIYWLARWCLFHFIYRFINLHHRFSGYLRKYHYHNKLTSRLYTRNELATDDGLLNRQAVTYEKRRFFGQRWKIWSLPMIYFHRRSSSNSSSSSSFSNTEKNHYGIFNSFDSSRSVGPISYIPAASLSCWCPW